MSKSHYINTHTKSLISQRFEMKYVLNEVEALAIREYIAPYVHLDPHVAPGELSYPINSLYLDSPDLRLYHSSATGEMNRFKLRFRSYSGDLDAPVSVEIKRRINDIIKKQTALLPKDYIKKLISRTEIDWSKNGSIPQSKREVTCQFRDLQETLWAKPKLFVKYDREPYISNFDEPVRITFDRNLTTLPCSVYREDMGWPSDEWQNVSEYKVILEIKFSNHFPLWVQKIIRNFELTRVSFSKYVVCLDAMQNQGLSLAG